MVGRWRALGGDQLVDSLAEVFQNEILFGRGLAVIDLLRPLLQRQLDAECLIDGKRDIQKVQAVDPQIVDRMLSGVMVSLGMSQVSAIMLAILSNVEDISKPLIY